MKILFVLEHFYPNIGGVETLFKQLTEILSDRGHQITVLTTRTHTFSPRKEKINKNLQVIRLNYFNRYLFTFLAFIPVLRYARGVDLIQTTSYNAGLPAYIGAKILRKKIVITFHESWGNLWFRLPYLNWLQRNGFYYFERLLLSFKYDQFIAVSESTRQSLIEQGVDEKRTSTIYNGLSYHNFKKSKETYLKTSKSGRFRAGYFGRLGVSKGLDFIIKAAEILKSEGEEIGMTLIIPRNPKRFHQKIQQMIDSKDLRNSIQVRSDLKEDELMAEIMSWNVVMIPSYSEGFCFVAVESSALGIPVISSHQKSLKEVVSGKSVIMEELSGQGLANSILKARNKEWNHIPEKRFPIEKTIDQYVSLYNRFASTNQNNELE